MSVPVLIVPVLNRPDLLGQMLQSVDYPIEKVIVIDNGDVVPLHPEPDRVRVIQTGHNLGVSASWNLGMKVTPTAPWWLISNSDVTFGPGDLARLDEVVDPGSDSHYFMLGMAIFALTRYTLARVGYLDENYHPAYDEDLDWHRRAILAGSVRIDVPFTGTHVGSATIYSDPELRSQNGRTHPANDAYYAQKWGGHKQGGERFTTPFGLNGHIGDWRLDPERLRNQAWKTPRSR